MIDITENGSDSTSNSTTTTAPQRSGRKTLFSLSRTSLHVRALLRLARRRPALALGLAVAAGSALTAVGTTTALAVQQVELRSSIEPLAPAPNAPLPPFEKRTRHHSLLHFPANPLRGLASWYGDVWNGRQTASGETFDETKLTAAHKTLPLGTMVRVTDLASMRTVVVKINDRGTLAPNRVIDLSSAAARQLGIVERGLASVKLEVLGKA